MFDPSTYDFARFGEILKDGWTDKAIEEANKIMHELWEEDESFRHSAQVASVVETLYQGIALQAMNKGFKGKNGGKPYMKYLVEFTKSFLDD